MSTAAIFALGLAAMLLTGLLLVRRLAGRKGVGVVWAAASLLLSSLCFGWLGVRVVHKAYHHGTQAVARVRQRLAPRTGLEIHKALFGQSLPNCLVVRNHQDQVVPRLDCCIWLEFTCCPAELRRILARDTAYRPVAYSPADSLSYSPRPAWWAPEKLGVPLLAQHKYAPDNPNRDQLLVFTADSTHVYYCDMAD